jgi:catechol 2,3-dioxygenase-like lactoylglutathione lyase family enzyme
MIKGLHAMFYSPKAEELRAFMRDKLGLPHTDVGEGWLIFDVPEADIGCHPSDRAFHEMSFYCDDIEATVAQLRAKGVEFASEITDEGWGLATRMLLPGDTEVMLYQPKYAK